MKALPLFSAAALSLAGATAIAAAAPLAVANPAAIGPAIGSPIATAMPLTDSRGRPTSLAKVAAGKPVMVVMFRSAAWCPYCQAQLKSLGPVAAAAKAKGIGFVAVSYDAPHTLAGFATKQKIAYPLLSDGGSRFIDAMKLRDPQYKADSPAFGVPYPTILLIGANGMLKAKSVATDYKVRPTNADIIAMLDRA